MIRVNVDPTNPGQFFACCGLLELADRLWPGAEGWFAGFPNAFPKESVEIFTLVKDGKIAEARSLYQPLVAAFRWDSRTEFVQAIKLGMDLVGRFGGPCRPPRAQAQP